jgi:hypothetical protein
MLPRRKAITWPSREACTSRKSSSSSSGELWAAVGAAAPASDWHHHPGVALSSRAAAGHALGWAGEPKSGIGMLASSTRGLQASGSGVEGRAADTAAVPPDGS